MKLDIQKFAVSKRTSFSESNLNPNQNTSSLTITIYFSAGNTQTYFTNTPLYCTCNGSTQSARVSHPRGGSVTQSFTFNNIQHNSDGTKSVSWNWNCNTGTSVLGNISDSGTRQLTTLHKPPLVTGYSIIETNQDLINIGIADNVFVANLSKKSVNINYELYDNATLLRASVYNSTNQNYLSNTLPVIMDFTQFPLYTTEDGVPIYVRITDSLNGATYFTNNGVVSGKINADFYNYINYIPISLTSSTTIAKRIGQISGRVGLNINGVYYNKTIGNVDQTSYKPIIKYKFWKYGDSEPSTYDYTIASENISTLNGTFSVSNYDIGSTRETDINYFDPEFAYRVKVYVEDNLTNTESSELQIQVGEAVWSEYPTRVDFKALSIQGELLNIQDISNEITFSVGYVNSQFKKLGNMIFLSYQSELRTHTTNELLFTMPNEYKPASQILAVCTLNGEAFGVVSMSTNGECSINFLSNTPSSNTRVYFQMVYFTK